MGFPLVVASISLLYQLGAALACGYLPHDSMYLARCLAAYIWIGCAFSLVGIAGAVLVSCSACYSSHQFGH